MNAKTWLKTALVLVLMVACWPVGLTALWALSDDEE